MSINIPHAPSEGVPSEPHCPAQLGLQPSDELNRGPRLPTHDADERGVVHVELLGESPQPYLINGTTNLEGNNARGLDSDVGAGDVRPVDRSVNGVLATGANHAVDAMSVGDGYGYDHSITMDDLIEAYRPRKTEHWEEVRTLVTTAVKAAQPLTWARGREMMKTAYEYIVWAWVIAAYELDITDLFHRTPLRLYIQQLTDNAASRARRSRYLAQMATCLTGSDPGNLVWVDSTPAPYSPQELARLLSDARSYSTDRMRTGALRVIELCAGAGLSLAEASDTRESDIASDGSRVAVRGKFERNAQVLPAWRNVLAGGSSTSNGFYVLADRTETDPAQFLRNFLNSLPGQAPNAHRLRATWLVEVLSRGISARDLLQLTQYKSFRVFDRYIEHIGLTSDHDFNIESLYSDEVTA